MNKQKTVLSLFVGAVMLMAGIVSAAPEKKAEGASDDVFYV